MLKNRELSRDAQLRVIRDEFRQPLKYQAKSGLPTKPKFRYDSYSSQT